jgi:putative transposase
VGLTGSPTYGQSILFKIAPTREVRNMISHLRRFEGSDIGKERLKILKFYDLHGEKTTKEAFCVGRKTINVWKRRLKIKGLGSLTPYSTKPKNTRVMMVEPKVLSEIKRLRQEHPRLGKSKVKPLLDQYCKSEGLSTYSEAKIGRIIKIYRIFNQRQGKMYHNPGSKYALSKPKSKRERTKYAPKPADFGYIQIDTVVRLLDGVRYYFYDAIDVKGKFALSLPYKNLNSVNTVDLMKKLMLVAPFKITTVQTDNGLEFLGAFEAYLKKINIRHIFIYPRCPRINGVVERFNRTLQEEFLDQNLDTIIYSKEFSLKLSQYLLFYNGQRVHQSLNNMTPLDYLYQKGGMSKMYRASTGY